MRYTHLGGGEPPLTCDKRLHFITQVAYYIIEGLTLLGKLLTEAFVESILYLSVDIIGQYFGYSI